MLSALPDGSFFATDEAPARPLRKSGKGATAWTDGIYQAARTVPDQAVTVVTPPSLVAVLAAGYPPALA